MIPDGLNLNAFTHIAGSFEILGKALPEEVNIKGADLVFIPYTLPATLHSAGREGAAAWSSLAAGMSEFQPPTHNTLGWMQGLLF